MNPANTTPVVLIGQGAYAKAWPSNGEPRQDRETLHDLAARVLDRCQRGEPVGDRDAERLARAVLQGAP